MLIKSPNLTSPKFQILLSLSILSLATNFHFTLPVSFLDVDLKVQDENQTFWTAYLLALIFNLMVVEITVSHTSQQSTESIGYILNSSICSSHWLILISFADIQLPYASAFQTAQAGCISLHPPSLLALALPTAA